MFTHAIPPLQTATCWYMRLRMMQGRLCKLYQHVPMYKLQYNRSSSMKDKAIATGHSTTEMAGQFAKQVNHHTCPCLYSTHHDGHAFTYIHHDVYFVVYRLGPREWSSRISAADTFSRGTKRRYPSCHSCWKRRNENVKASHRLQLLKTFRGSK